MKSFITFLITALVVSLVIFGAIAYSALTWGLVFWNFWYWFVLPVFPLLPQVTFIQSIGLMLFVSLFKVQVPTQIKDEYREKTTEQIMSLILPFITLFMGWIVKIFFL